MSDSDKSIYQWQQSRRRKDAAFNFPATGFGPSGDYVLWLPSPIEKESWDLSDPENPILRTGGSCFDDPQLAALRDEAFECLKPMGGIGNVFRIGTAFVKYASAMIRLNYDLTPDDLQFLITGNGWHQSILEHLLGGTEATAKLSKLNVADVLASPAIQAQDEQIVSRCPDPAPRKGILARARERIFRR